MFGGVIMRGMACAAAALLCGSAAAASESGPRFTADLSVGYFTGDYGTDETTEIQVVSPRLRWQLPRGELRVSFPALHLQTSGPVTLVGSTPVSPDSADKNLDLPEEGRVTEESVEGMGDVSVYGELDLLRGGAARPWITGLVRVKLPTADEEENLGTGEADFEGGLRWIQPFGRTYLMADATYTRVGDPDDYELEDVVQLGAGVSRRFGATSVQLFLENRSHPTPGRGDRINVALGASRRFGALSRLRLAGSTFVGLSETAEDFGLFLTVGRSF